MISVSPSYLASAQQKNNASVMNPVRSVNITRKEKEYRGMLEYRVGDESRLLKNVVTGTFNLFKQIEQFSELFLELHGNVFSWIKGKVFQVCCFEMSSQI